MISRDVDVIVVGSGPNGLAAAITAQQQGLSTLLVEARSAIGGGLRTEELTLPGFHHDVCSAIHPMGAGSPFLERLPLAQFGLEYVQPPVAAAHPFDDGSCAALFRSIDETIETLGADAAAYRRYLEPIVRDWSRICRDVLGPLRIPAHPLAFASFGLRALPSAERIAARFSQKHARGLWGGIAAHSVQSLSNTATAAIGLVLTTMAHVGGWPLAKGGSVKIARALSDYFVSLGGRVETGFRVDKLSQLPSAHAIIFDVTPRQLLKIAGERLSSLYAFQLRRYRYGPGVYKVDWALDAAIPFVADAAGRAGTVHLGNNFEEIAGYEKEVWENRVGEKPFVLLAQQSLFDATRAPEGKHTAWAYCHVPNGYTGDMTDAIEKQVERFAPGFRERIIGRHVFTPSMLEEYNSNYVGGDIGGGAIDIGQLFTRPALRSSPYRTSRKGLYLCSASTPPGGGTHGLCGYYAARRALKDVFGMGVEEL